MLARKSLNQVWAHMDKEEGLLDLEVELVALHQLREDEVVEYRLYRVNPNRSKSFDKQQLVNQQPLRIDPLKSSAEEEDEQEPEQVVSLVSSN